MHYRLTDMTHGRRAGFTLLEVIIAIGIIALLLALLLPALERAREQANNLRCATNLNQIGVALVIYSNDNHGQYPRTTYIPGAPLCAGTNAAAPDPFKSGGPQPNDVTAPLFLLMRAEGIPPKIFNEPYNDELVNEPEPTKTPLSRSNFTDYRKNLGYSFANPYPDAHAVAAGYQFLNKMNSAFALAADLNPGTGANQNSRNHEKRGQNVLFADYHVEWKFTALCGVKDERGSDDIYTSKTGDIMVSPVDGSTISVTPGHFRCSPK